MFILAVVIIVALVAANYSEWWDKERQDLDPTALGKRVMKSVVLVVPVMLVLTLVKDSVVVVPAGHRAVVFDKFQGVKQNSLKEGFNFIMPFLQEAVLFDIRIRKAEYDATAASKDLQSVHTKVALNFHPDADAVANLYRNVGSDYAEKIIHPAMQEAVKATTALYTAEELITRREEVKKHIHELLQRQTIPAKIQITDTYITDFDFSADFARAVESKQIAEQQAFKARRDLDRIKIEAEQKIAQARAEAQSLAMQREAITANLIELRRIEAQKLAIDKWNGQLPQTMLGGATPFIDVSKFGARQNP
jgi:regulator of protease activity HflC (stomatin/prohibitin superfamily)